MGHVDIWESSSSIERSEKNKNCMDYPLAKSVFPLDDAVLKEISNNNNNFVYEIGPDGRGLSANMLKLLLDRVVDRHRTRL